MLFIELFIPWDTDPRKQGVTWSSSGEESCRPEPQCAHCGGYARTYVRRYVRTYTHARTCARTHTRTDARTQAQECTPVGRVRRLTYVIWKCSPKRIHYCGTETLMLLISHTRFSFNGSDQKRKVFIASTAVGRGVGKWRWIPLDRIGNDTAG